jgi:PAS domain S-box-containing protein
MSLADADARIPALREVETRLSAFIEQSPVAMLVLQGERWVAGNSAAAALFHLETADQLLERTPLEFAPERQPDGRLSREAIQDFSRRAQREGGVKFEWENLLADGQTILTQVSLGCLQVEQEHLLQWVAVDITETRRAEQIQAALYRIALSTMEATSLQELARRIHGILAGLIQAQNFYVAIFDERTGLMSFPYYADEMDSMPQPRRLGRTLTDLVLKSGEAHLLTPEIIDALIRAGAAEVQGTRPLDWLGVPLLAGEVPFGVMVVQSYTSTVRYTEATVDLLRFVSTQVAASIRRKQAEEAARQEHARTERYLAVAEVILVTFDLQGRVTMLNRKGHSVLGYPEGSLLGRDWIQTCLPPEARPGVTELFRQIAAGRMEPMGYRENLVLCKDGSKRLIAWHNAVITGDDGGPFEILSSGEDITERRQAEAERALLEAQLSQAQKMESLGSLAGGVAHDMNNVLGAILAMSSAHLETQPKDSPVYRAFDKIAQAATRGGKMVQGLLSFARKNPSEEREVDLNALLSEQAQFLEHTTLSRIRLELDLAPHLRLITGDPNALTPAFMNLFVNSLDAMPNGGTLLIRTRNRDQASVEVLVEDTGCGMSKEVLAKALDPFFTTKAVGKGTGLGLSLVYSTVKAHCGRVEIQSEPGRGTRVKLWFPARTDPARAADAALGGAAAPAEPMSVLLVDDDDLFRDSAQVLLETLGYRVSVAARGEEGLAQLEAGLDPDVVILDVNMPGLGGGDTLVRLRALRPDLPVLLATGRVDQTAVELTRTHPRVVLMAKPFGLHDLQRQLGWARRR